MPEFSLRVRLALRFSLVPVMVGLLAVSQTGAEVSEGTPPDTGMSAERLRRIDEVIQRAIGAKRISGAVTLVSRRGELAHFEAHGLMDVEADRAMQKDTIFSIASMTKPVAGVAILMLVEEGKVRLSDPVSRFIPEFRDTKVAIRRSTSGDEESEADIYTVPADREITVRDLMTHTSGLVSGGAGSREASRIAPRRFTDTVGEYAAELGSAPLDFQPGTQWAYSGLAGIDTLGRIVEVASGLTFDEFLRQRIFEPLGMHDTAFNVALDRQSRVVTLYGRAPAGLERRAVPEWVGTKTLFSGWRRVGKGFGLTVDVVLDSVKAGEHRSTGSFGWSGAFGTTFWVDWSEDMTAILMVQTPGDLLRADFQNAVMQAIID